MMSRLRDKSPQVFSGLFFFNVCLLYTALNRVKKPDYAVTRFVNNLSYSSVVERMVS